MSKKLSKSNSDIFHEVEVFPHNRNGEVVWLWACQHGCYDQTPYDKSSELEANKLAEEHSSVAR